MKILVSRVWGIAHWTEKVISFTENTNIAHADSEPSPALRKDLGCRAARSFSPQRDIFTCCCPCPSQISFTGITKRFSFPRWFFSEVIGPQVKMKWGCKQKETLDRVSFRAG